METIYQLFTNGVEQLIARTDGPLHFRFIVMPIVVTALAIRSGIKDAREGRPPFLWGMITASSHRLELLNTFFKDVARVFVMASIVDLLYQVFVLHGFYPLQLLFVATSFSTGPYLLIRGPVTRIARLFFKVPVQPAKTEA
jgi:hypothetical protein